MSGGWAILGEPLDNNDSWRNRPKPWGPFYFGPGAGVLCKERPPTYKLFKTPDDAIAHHDSGTYRYNKSWRYWIEWRE